MATTSLAGTNALLVNPNQKGNPILKFIRNVHWQFCANGVLSSSGSLAPDYLLGSSTVAIFISLRYHLLHPEYIHTRLKNCKEWLRQHRGGGLVDVKGKIVMVQIDTEDSQVWRCVWIVRIPLLRIDSIDFMSSLCTMDGSSRGRLARSCSWLR